MVAFGKTGRAVLTESSSQHISFQIIIVQSAEITDIHIFLLGRRCIGINRTSVQCRYLVGAVSGSGSIHILVQILLIGISYHRTDAVFIGKRSCIAGVEFQFLPLLIRHVGSRLPRSIHRVGTHECISMAVLRKQRSGAHSMPSFQNFPIKRAD